MAETAGRRGSFARWNGAVRKRDPLSCGKSLIQTCYLAMLIFPCHNKCVRAFADPETGTFERPFPRHCEYLTAPCSCGVSRARMQDAKETAGLFPRFARERAGKNRNG